MVNFDSPDKISVFVGFGGSGGKMLREYAALVASDHRWSDRAAKDLYFVLCDTDADDIRESAQKIESTFASHAAPFVDTLHLAENAVSVEDEITRRFLRENEAGTYSKADKERFESAWWFRSDNAGNRIPFKVKQLVFAVQRGAGQCPMVSYFLAWVKAQRVRQQVSKLVDAIDNRRATGGKKPQVELTLAASLAGGTGRGCWYILSFMLRRELISRGYTPKPAIGYFLDQGVFSDVQAGQPEQAVKMRVNSLTGLSELIMWIRIENQDKEEAPEYFLPSIESPGTDDCDAITSHKRMGMHDLTAHAPLSNAQLVFSHSKTSRLNRPDEYYKMVAAALYARTAEHKIDAKQINSMPRIGALGSTRVEVPHRSIDSYLKRQVICNLLEEAVDGAGASVKFPAALVPDHPSGHWILSRFEESSRTSSKDKAKQAIKSARLESSSTNFDDAKKRLKQYVQVSNDEADHNHRMMAELLFESPSDGGFLVGKVEKYESLLREYFISQVSSQSDDFRMTAAARSAQALYQRLTQTIKGLQDVEEAGKSAVGQFEAKLEEFKGRGDGNFWSKLFSFRIFTDNEIKKTETALVEAIIQVQKGQVATQLVKVLEDVRNDMLVRSKNIQTVANKVLAELVRDFDHEKQEQERSTFIMPKTSSDRSLAGFTDWKIEDKFREPHDPARFVHRTLHPVMDEQVERCCQAVLQSPHISRNRDALSKLVQEHIEESETSTDGQNRLTQRLREQLDHLMSTIDIPDEIIRTHFNFSTVVEGQLKMWNDVFRARPSETNDLLNKFREHFGCRDSDMHWDRAESTPRCPDLQVVLESIALSAARDCDPFVVIEAGADTRDEQGDFAQVVLPDVEGYGEKARNRLKSRYMEAGLRLQEWVLGGRDDSPEGELERRKSVRPSSLMGNPYILVGYTMKSILDETATVEDSSSFRRVRSMQYFREPGRQKLMKWLKDTESTAGESVFTNMDGNLGLGYSDPRFVLNPEYRDLRWRPWVDREQEEAKELRRGHLAAILYAMRGVRSERASADQKLRVDQYFALLESLDHEEARQLVKPMLAWDSKSNRFKFQRNPIGARTNTLVRINGSAHEELSFKKFFEYFEAMDREKDLVELIMTEKDLYYGSLSPDYGIGTIHHKALDESLLAFLEEMNEEMSSYPNAAEEILPKIQELIEMQENLMRD